MSGDVSGYIVAIEQPEGEVPSGYSPQNVQDDCTRGTWDQPASADRSSRPSVQLSVWCLCSTLIWPISILDCRYLTHTPKE